MTSDDAALQAYETTFQQDLNGDGRVGPAPPPPPPPPTVVEADGATSLVRVGSNYFVYPVGGSSGPVVSTGGSAFVAGQFIAFLPIGAEQMTTRFPYTTLFRSNQYSVWTADSNA